MDNEEIAKSSDEALSFEEKEEAKFYIVSSIKFWILTFASFGFYSLVWFYKNWEAYRIATRDNISPLWRTIFYPFYIFELRDKVKEFCDEKRVKSGFEFDILPYALIIIISISYFSNSSNSEDVSRGLKFAISILSSDIALPVFQSRFRKYINIASGDELGESNSKLTLENYFWLGLLWSILIYMIIFLKDKYL